MHEPHQSSSSACAALLTHWAVDLLVSQVIAEALTAPRQHVLLLLQCFFDRTLPTQDLDLQSLEEALVGPVRVAAAPVALLQPFTLGTAPPLVIGAVALPAETGVWGVVEPWHLERPPWPESKGHVRW